MAGETQFSRPWALIAKPNSAFFMLMEIENARLERSSVLRPFSIHRSRISTPYGFASPDVGMGGRNDFAMKWILDLFVIGVDSEIEILGGEGVAEVDQRKGRTFREKVGLGLGFRREHGNGLKHLL